MPPPPRNPAACGAGGADRRLETRAAQHRQNALTLIAALATHNAALHDRIRNLEARLATNSRNSSKPPASDGLRKRQPQSRRPRGQRRPGGQPGHLGSTLRPVDRPDVIIPLPVTRCDHCGTNLTDQSADRQEKRQVFDLPPIKLNVTEYQADIKTCPHCHHCHRAPFPAHVKAPTQYGPRFHGTAVYAHVYQLLPYHRTAQFLNNLYGTQCSPATLYHLVQNAADTAAPRVADIRARLAHADVVHFDETGCRVNGTLQWLHTASTADFSYFEVHPKRGGEAMNHIAILPTFPGTAVHDHWHAYFNYDCRHALCNAHHLRELIFAHEQDHQAWAATLSAFLLATKDRVDHAKAQGLTALTPDRLAQIDAEYRALLDRADQECPPPPPSPPGTKKTGRRKKSKSRNLLERLRRCQAEVLAFAHNFRVPFDNNQAERDIRMIKVKLKISGTFRTTAGAADFACLRSYVLTASKLHLSPFDACIGLAHNDPFRLPPAPN